MATLDFNTTVRLQDHISRRFDGPFSLLSEIGKFEVMSIILLIIFFVTKRFSAGVLAVSLFISFHLFELFGKYFVHHPPPPQFMLRTQHLAQFPEFTVRSVNSYPSGHAGRTVFVSIILLTLIWRSGRLGTGMKLFWSGCILGFAVSMMVSRIYLGEHWLSDVIGGSLLGGALGLFASVLLDKKQKNQSAKKNVRKGLFPKFKIEVKRVE